MLCRRIQTNRIVVEKCKPQKIVHTFNITYKNTFGDGVGDFIRGTFYLFAYCRSRNIKVDIDISQHPIAKYLETMPPDDLVDYKEVLYFRETGTTPELYKYIHSPLNSDKIIYLSTNVRVRHPIPDSDKHLLQSKFIPNKELQTVIDETLCRLDLIKKEYNVIHIRTGDEYLVEKKPLCQTLITNIYKNIAARTSASESYLLLTDSNELKTLLQKTHPHFKMEVNEIAHVALNEDGNNTALKNTMIDFFLIANAKSAIGLSVYGHISGFSMYCCAMNNIPYTGTQL
jgi:hypothetical protein